MASHELKKLAIEQGFEARKLFAEQVHQSRLEMIRSVHSWGQLCLRSSLVLNGGAILAVLTLLGATGKGNVPRSEQLFAPEQFGSALICYVAGLLLTCIAMFLAYANWNYNALIYPHVIDAANNLMQPEPKWPGAWLDKKILRRISFTMSWCIAGGIAAYVLFVVGSVKIGTIFGVDVWGTFYGWSENAVSAINLLRIEYRNIWP